MKSQLTVPCSPMSARQSSAIDGIKTRKIGRTSTNKIAKKPTYRLSLRLGQGTELGGFLDNTKMPFPDRLKAFWSIVEPFS